MRKPFHTSNLSSSHSKKRAVWARVSAVRRIQAETTHLPGILWARSQIWKNSGSFHLATPTELTLTPMEKLFPRSHVFASSTPKIQSFPGAATRSDGIDFVYWEGHLWNSTFRDQAENTRMVSSRVNADFGPREGSRIETYSKNKWFATGLYISNKCQENQMTSLLWHLMTRSGVLILP